MVKKQKNSFENKNQSVKNIVQKKIFSCVSFFSGCGGMDLGFLGDFSYKNKRFTKNNIEILAAFDNDRMCVETYNKYFKDHASQLNLGEADCTGMPKADILIGGFPCQDFSACGPRRGLDSDRGKLYQAMVRYMEVHKPKIVVGENVPFLKLLNGGDVLKTIIKDIERTGYEVDVWKLRATEYGVPQDRIRLFIVAKRADLVGFPEIPQPKMTTQRYSIDWAIDDLVFADNTQVPNHGQYFTAKRAINSRGQGDEVNQVGRPSYTIRANSRSRIQFHYSLPRRLTVRECARIQTFPDDFIFPHSTTTNTRQIGNAVPPVLAHAVAQSIQMFLEKQK
jgi:DNA (cytosine-5)-methyltransferase 1